MIVSMIYYRVLHDHPTHRHPLPLPFDDRSFSFSTSIGHNQAQRTKQGSKGGSPPPQVASVGGEPFTHPKAAISHSRKEKVGRVGGEALTHLSPSQ